VNYPFKAGAARFGQFRNSSLIWEAISQFIVHSDLLNCILKTWY